MTLILNKIKYLLLFIFLQTLLLAGYGQGHDNEVYNGYTDFLTQLQDEGYLSGNIHIFQDERINLLIYKHIKANRRSEGVPGYRIRIFAASGQNSKQNALSEKSRFLKKYPGIQSYLVYDTPDYKIYVGDFRTQTEAYKAYQRILVNFPAAFIVNDNINTHLAK